MEVEDRKLLGVYGVIAFLMAFLAPIFWFPLAELLGNTPLATIPDPTLRVMVRVDTLCYLLTIVIATVVGVSTFKHKLKSTLKLLIMILYSATLYFDSTVLLLTGAWDINALHGVNFFSIHLQNDIYVYLSIMMALIAVYISTIKYWWQALLTTPYLWNLYCAEPFVNLPLRNVLPIPEFYGPGMISLVALIINIGFTIFILYMVTFVKKREEERELYPKGKKTWRMFQEPEVYR